jgi:hypothetical protein
MGVDLVERSRVVFIAIPGWEQRLDHRLEDAFGTEIGSALEQPRPRRWSKNGRRSRFTTVSVEIYDHHGARRLSIIRPPGLRWAPLEVFDAGGSPLGSIARNGRGRFVLRDRWAVAIGAIARRSRSHAVNYSITDSLGLEVATISDFRHLHERRSSDESLWAKVRRAAYAGSAVNEHVLQVSRPVSRELRLLILAAAAGVYLVLQTPFQDGGD